MRILKYMLPLLVLLLWGGAAKAQYNPADPPEPGVYFTLTTRSVPANAGYSFSGGGTHAFGSDVRMQVSGNTGFRFVGWEDEDGTIVSTTSSFTYVMPARNVVLTAHFIYDPTSPAEPSTPEFKDVSYISFRINPSDAGYISSGSAGEYEVGTTKSFTAQAYSNYRFVNWTCEGIELGTSSTLDYTIPKGDRVLEANFAYNPSSPAEPSVPNIPRTLTLKSNPEGATYSFTGNGSHSVGESFSVSQRSNTYYHFVNWTDEEGNIVSETSSFTYTMPDRHVTLTANYTYNYNPSSPGEPGTPNPDGTVAENMVLWPRMGMYDDTHVQILCETPGATIHYTLDGSTPNAESPVYTEPVFVGSNLLVKAIAYKEGMEDSPVVSYQVTAYKAGTPIFTFENLKLKITSSTEGATIRFTTDFTDPTEESEVYTEPFLPEENCRIKAYASKEGLADSPINIFVFRRADYTIPVPTLTMNDEGLLVITPSVNGGSTYYTIDGTDPSTASSIYTEPLALDGNFTVKAYTVHPSYYDSPVGEYVIEGYQVADPTYEYRDRALTFATATAGATVRYTTDGTVPTEESVAYTSPLGLTEDCKVIAKGFKANYVPSDTISYTFIYVDHKAATPTVAYDPELLTVSMACGTENAEIRYTIDGAAPTSTTGILYEGPVAVTGNHTYTAKAFRSDLFDSEEASVEVDDQKVPSPTASFVNRRLTLTCADVQAQIRYTTDGSDPTQASTLYEAPVALTEDCTVRFVAQRQYFHDSDIETYEFKVADHQVATPVLTYDPEALTVSMECGTENAEIRYTIDGEAPTSTTGILYDGPVTVTGNHTYTAKAFRSDLLDSEAARVVVNGLQVATPVVSHSIETLKVTMYCPTEGAQIRYTTDGSVPTATTGTVYTEPIDINGNMTYTVRAFLTFFIDSEIVVYEVADMKLPTPTAVYGKHTVTLSCEEEMAELHYTLDGSQATSESALYGEPIPMTEDCTVRFIATKTGYNDSDEGAYSFSLADWQETAPEVTKDFRNRRIHMQSESAAGIRVVIDGISQILAARDSIDVEPGMRSIEFTAIAADDDRYDSDTLTEELVFHLPPVLWHDGFEGHVMIDTDDPAPDGAERHFELGYDIYVDDRDIIFRIPGFDTMVAHVESDHAFRSDVAWKEIEYYNTGEEAGAIHGYSLRDAFQAWNDRLDEFPYLRVTGDLNRDDLRFLAGLPHLTRLTISTGNIIEDCDSVFAGSRIETLHTFFLSPGMLKSMPRLTTLIWRSDKEAVPGQRLSEAGNPNLLLWVRSAGLAPENFANVVEYELGYSDPASIYIGVKGTAERISLTAGYPFNVHKEIEVGSISLVKEFRLPTEIGACSGWETLTVPFDVEDIRHEAAGEIKPFGLWTGRYDTAKPFWLYSANDSTATGWEEATAIEAGTPYIISMPNNEEYVDGYSLPGRVTFSAKGVTLTPEGIQPEETDWIDGMTFVGTYMPVEETGIRSLNVNNAAGRDWLGSAFVDEDETLPFGAYMRGEGMPKHIPVFGDWSGVLTPSQETGGITIETPAPGAIRVSSTRDCRVAIVTPDGATVRVINLKGGESATADGLTRGLYIAAGVKVMVR